MSYKHWLTVLISRGGVHDRRPPKSRGPRFPSTRI